MKRVLLPFLVTLLVLSLARVASAHQVDLSQGTYRVEGATVHASLVFAEAALATAMPDLDADHDGRLSQAELDADHDVLGRELVDGVHVRAAGKACEGALRDAKLGQGDAVTVDADYACDGPAGGLSFDFAFVSRFPAGHRHLATITGADGKDHTFLATLGNHVATAGNVTASASFLGMIRTGVLHILTGYDHLAFLFGVLLLGGRLRDLVATITAFTIAHSISLGVAVLGIFSVRSGIVEPLIALSIVYVGVEDVFDLAPDRRWRITFPFGLVHGFGFAGGLVDLHLPRPQIPAALFAFNSGVEIGQLLVVAAMLPLIYRARKNAWARTTGTKIASLALVIAGMAWFFQRVFA